jgi:hypothetical protein
MKKSPASKAKPKHAPKQAKKTIKSNLPPAGDPIVDGPLSEESVAEDQFAVTGREEEASSSGHRIEPIINDEEGNAEKLIEEGLHGYMHVSKKDRP